MQFEGDELLPTTREALWALVGDVSKAVLCLPGLDQIEVVKPGEEYRLLVRAELGSIRPLFDLTLVVSSLEPPREARLRIRGKGAGSHVGASSYMQLTDAPDGATALRWSLVFTVSGTIATVGNRLLEDVFRTLCGQFFANLRERVRTGADSGAAVPEPTTPA